MLNNLERKVLTNSPSSLLLNLQLLSCHLLFPLTYDVKSISGTVALSHQDIVVPMRSRVEVDRHLRSEGLRRR